MSGGEIETPGQARRRRDKRRRLVGSTLVSVLAHVGVILAVLWASPTAVRQFLPEPEPVVLSLVPGPKPTPPGPPKDKQAAKGPPKAAPPKPPKAAKTKAKPTPPKTPPQKVIARRPPPKPTPVKPLDAADEEADAAPVPELTDAQLAAARTAESGGGGGGGGSGAGGGGGGRCDMVRWLQDKLRQDARVQAAVARAHAKGGGRSKAILVWDGDWIRSPGEEGKGVAGVREAILVEVAFAPAACRNEPMSGLVLISLSDTPGSVRIGIGSGRWRWTDLLHPRRSF